ncbi:MAG: flagellar assembly protein FliW [Lachnospiraceae bacterium]|nr:flagellar assembly protein FliW [Lachnospiraceae bacterium]MBP3506712.1 flagellar assembly protein FliW [Lachnospiraceae bacterium]
MVAQTRLFGEVTIDDDKVLDFPNGIIGIEDKHKFAIIYDVEKGEDTAIRWLQSMEDPYLALPVIEPFAILEEYNPIIEDALLEPIDNPKDEDIIVLLTLIISSDVTKVTANMKAPIVINSATCKGGQIIVENPEYESKFNVYNAIQKKKAGE